MAIVYLIYHPFNRSQPVMTAHILTIHFISPLHQCYQCVDIGQVYT